MVYYFIFGGEATNIIYRVGFKYFVDNYLDIEHEAFEFANGDDPCNLLERYTGWSDYYVMNKEEWDKYQKACMIK